MYINLSLMLAPLAVFELVYTEAPIIKFLEFSGSVASIYNDRKFHITSIIPNRSRHEQTMRNLFFFSSLILPDLFPHG